MHMWLNEQQTSDVAIRSYRQTLRHASVRHVVIDDLFADDLLQQVWTILQQEGQWQTQQHTYQALYVDTATWQSTPNPERFVQRQFWQRGVSSTNVAEQFLQFLRSPSFMALLSRIFSVQLTDESVAEPLSNTNYFRLGHQDFVRLHADDSPGREVCMLLYLNQNWQPNFGGELVFQGCQDEPIQISPRYNRCVLFDPCAPGSEHWVNAVTSAQPRHRLNVTSWYWSR